MTQPPEPSSSPAAPDQSSGAATAGAPKQSGPTSGDIQRLLAGRYRLESLLGRGTMGAVWKAQDVVLGRAVAVKEVILPPTQTDEENHVAIERALREARSIAALSHPNVVTLYDVVEDDGRPWVVMELVPAKSLAQIIIDHGTLPPHEAARIGIAVLNALHSAHEVGITHRDVKPGNILVTPDGLVKLADFGISRRSDDSQLTSAGLMVGSPSYIAPEVARGRPAGSAADIWGLGATLQCAIEGAPPFDLGDPVSTLTAVVSDPPAPAPHAGALQPILARMLEKDPRHRIQTGELRDELRRVASQRPGSGPRPIVTPRPGQPVAQPPRPAQSAGAPPRPHQQTSIGTPMAQPPQRAAGGLPGGFNPALPAGQVPAPSAATGFAPVPAPRVAPVVQARPGAKSVPWIPIVIGIVVALLIAGAVYWIATRDDNSTQTGSGTPTSTSAPIESSEPVESSDSPETSDPPPTSDLPPPDSNDSAVNDGVASGAISVNGTFYRFQFEVDGEWEVATANAGRTDFVMSSGGTDPNTMVRISVVAGELQTGSVDAQIRLEQSLEGSPARLPDYQNIEYQVSDDGDVRWRYTSSLQGEPRRGYFYATLGKDNVLWKVILSGPDTAGDIFNIANHVVDTFEA